MGSTFPFFYESDEYGNHDLCLRKVKTMKLDILAFGAHPDDVELGAGGILATHAAAGKKVGIVDLTRGYLDQAGVLSRLMHRPNSLRDS